MNAAAEVSFSHSQVPRPRIFRVSGNAGYEIGSPGDHFRSGAGEAVLLVYVCHVRQSLQCHLRVSVNFMNTSLALIWSMLVRLRHMLFTFDRNTQLKRFICGCFTQIKRSIHDRLTRLKVRVHKSRRIIFPSMDYATHLVLWFHTECIPSVYIISELFAHTISHFARKLEYLKSSPFLK